MNTDEAFKKLLDDEYLWGRTGEAPDRRRYFKHLVQKKKNLTTDKKMELLQKAGFVVVQDIKWGLTGGFERETNS
ncbi:hypothetical protein [Telluribacter humicola]|uniref:hypothetical protein n=1 Tax=Telluribacter humicola TaxID=1720261 RepID=UPI001A96D514|nr:hypothetical protein [Telluribacter humicola]